MQGFVISSDSEPTPEAFRTDISNNRMQTAFGYDKEIGIIRQILLRKWNDMPLKLTIAMRAETSEKFIQYKSLFLADANIEIHGANHGRINLRNIESLEQLMHAFVRINTIEPLPEELINKIKLACGYLPIVFSLDTLIAKYIESKDRAVKYVNDSDEVDNGLFALAYLAHHGELPNFEAAEAARGGAESGGAAGSVDIELDEQFAIEQYMAIPEGSPYYKQANFHSASIILAHLGEYEGLEKESALKQLMDFAYASGDIRLLGHAFTVCTGQDLSRTIEADSISDLLYKLAVRQRAPVSSSTVTPVAAAMIAGGAGAASSAEMPRP